MVDEYRQARWIEATLQNDEMSSDDELRGYFRDAGVNEELIEKAIKQRPELLLDHRRHLEI
jgi:hypothetical protein